MSLRDVPTESIKTASFGLFGGSTPASHSSGPKKIYLAGKIGKLDWRHRIVNELSRSVTGVCFDSASDPFPEIMEFSIFNEHHYVGPFFVGCDHGCFHGSNTHGQASVHEHETPGDRTQLEIRNRALSGIKRCDLFFAYIESEDCYGTLFEIGYAKALGKKIVILTNGVMKDLWFSLVADVNVEVFDITFQGENSSPQNFLLSILNGGVDDPS